MGEKSGGQLPLHLQSLKAELYTQSPFNSLFTDPLGLINCHAENLAVWWGLTAMVQGGVLWFRMGCHGLLLAGFRCDLKNCDCGVYFGLLHPPTGGKLVINSFNYFNFYHSCSINLLTWSKIIGKKLLEEYLFFLSQESSLGFQFKVSDRTDTVYQVG